MSGKTWTPQDLALLRARYPDESTRIVATSLCRSLATTYAKANQLGLRKSEAFNATAASGRIPKGAYIGPDKAWVPDEIDTLRQHYSNEKTSELARALCRDVTAIYAMAKKLGLEKSSAFLESEASGRLKKGSSVGAATRFQKGNRPWIAGKRGVTTGGKATQFKKGAKPHNHVPVGTEVMATIGYLKRKVAEPNQWEFVHLLVWEGAYGPVPHGSMLRFRDGNRRNCALENLECITRQEHMARVTIHRYPPEVRSVIRLQGRLNRLIQGKANEKQD